jgi:hypothetical protein
MIFVNNGEIHDVAILPNAVLNTVMENNAAYAPKNTII